MGRAAVDVRGMFANSLIPSSGVKAAQPSVRADPWHLPIFNNTVSQSKVDSSVKHLWCVNDANIHAVVRLGEEKNNKRCEAKEHKTPSDYLTVTFAYMPFIWRAKI